MGRTIIDPGLVEYCKTDWQREVIEHLLETQNCAETAKALGTERSIPSAVLNRVRKYAAAEGFAPGHFTQGTVPGYRMGKVTFRRNASGEVLEYWDRQSPGAEHELEILREAVQGVLKDAEPLSPATPPSHCDVDLLTVIPMGDPHFGLLTWAKQVGENFDLDIAEAMTCAAVDRLTAAGPPSHTAMLLNLGDYFHADDSTNRTRRSGAVLDVDGRFEKIAAVGIMAMVRCIRRLLEKHQRVIVRNNRGNHDPHQAYMLTLALEGWFNDEPRVEIEPSPSAFYYYRFGRTLIGSVHGDGPKVQDLPLIMANDVPADWAAADFRVWHCGHVHHDQRKEYSGCIVETHRSIVPGDSWHHASGYRSGRDMKAIVYHREHGEVTRIRCGISMLDAEEPIQAA